MTRFLLAAAAWTACAPAAFAVSPAELLSVLDRSRPELRAISTAHELAEYFRHRARPIYKLSERATPADTEAAERAMRHEFRSIGIPHNFGPRIDWAFDKTAEGGLAPNNEWTWQLNRGGKVSPTAYSRS